MRPRRAEGAVVTCPLTARRSKPSYGSNFAQPARTRPREAGIGRVGQRAGRSRGTPEHPGRQRGEGLPCAVPPAVGSERCSFAVGMIRGYATYPRVVAQ